jgi:hypothetical protein
VGLGIFESRLKLPGGSIMGPKDGSTRDSTGQWIGGSLFPFPDFGNGISGGVHFVFEGPTSMVQAGKLG